LQYENLDEQHKGLFQGVFAVAAGRSDAAALSHLKDSVKKHFDTEEVCSCSCRFVSVLWCLQCFDAGRQEGHPACEKQSGGLLASLLVAG